MFDVDCDAVDRERKERHSRGLPVRNRSTCFAIRPFSRISGRPAKFVSIRFEITLN
jgi:hypothetical protein